MADILSAYRGCLLGMAVGDALGGTVDGMSWAQIQENYGPCGLLGFDLQETEFAQVTSYTQIAAYLCNALLIGLSRTRTDRVEWGRRALLEWTRRQQFPRDPEPTVCWVAKMPCFRRRLCRDARMYDNLRLQAFGTVSAPKNNHNGPGAITAGVAAGLFYQDGRIRAEEVGTLAANLIALTHGDPETFLTGVVLAYTLAGILQEPERPLEAQFTQAIAVMDGQFRGSFAQSEDLARQLTRAMALRKTGTVTPREGMEQLGCRSASQVLAGAMFACLSSPGDFDGAIVTAVNHSGASAAVGAVTGAILGAKFTEDGIPAFYLESLECGEALGVLAQDMAVGSPASGVFDDTWDHKYVQGLPPERD